VNNDATRFINFGREGYNALESIANSFIERLPNDVEQNFARVAEKPWFCGFSNRDVRFCLIRMTAPELTFTFE
jgi:hypothetical protein